MPCADIKEGEAGRTQTLSCRRRGRRRRGALEDRAEIKPGSLPDAGWAQWRERCAAQLCDPCVRDRLQGFVGARFNGYVWKYMDRGRKGWAGCSMPAQECMHLLESFMAIGAGRKGKAYKLWLFARSECGDAGAIESGVSLLVRDVVREHLRRECSPSFMVSTDEPVYGGDDGGRLTIADLVAGACGPDVVAGERELRKLAMDGAASIAQEMKHREVVAVLAREWGLSLADPVVLDAAGCRKSALNECHRRICERVAGTVKERFAREEATVLRQLALMTFRELIDLVVRQARMNPACARLFEMCHET